MANKTETRKGDESKEIITTDAFIDYYNRIKGENDTIEIVRDKERQVKGIDVILNYKGKKYTIDLKANTDYINQEKPLWSFVQEITTLNNNGAPMIGWLLNTNLENEYISFMWIDKTKDGKLTCAEDIESAEIAIVKKEKIINYLANLGMTRDLLLSIAFDLRYHNGENVETLTDGKYKAVSQFGRIYVGNKYKDGFGIVFSKEGKDEQPVNVMVPRKVLIGLSEIHNKITPDFIY